MSIFYYYIQSIPESMGIIALSLALAQVKLRWGRIFIGGVFISILTYYIRALNIGFGLHLPVVIFVIFLAITRMTNVRPSQVIIAIFLSFFSLALLEFLVSTAFLVYTHKDLEQAIANEKLWALIGIVQDSILISLALIISIFRKPTEEAEKCRNFN